MVILFLFSTIILFILFNCLSSLIDCEIFGNVRYLSFFFLILSPCPHPLGIIQYVARCRYKIYVIVMNGWNIVFGL